MFRCFTLLIILLVGCSPAAYKRETNKRTHLEIVPYQRPGIHSARWEIEASLEGVKSTVNTNTSVTFELTLKKAASSRALK